MFEVVTWDSSGGGSERLAKDREMPGFARRTAQVGCPTLVSREAKRQKKRPELHSSGRLGSPPPELPNHKLDVIEGQIQCKRHFGNRVLAVLEAVLNRHRRSLNMDDRNYGCLCQVWPSSRVVQTSVLEVVTVPFCESEN
jgi:hypothetical protein